MRVRETASRENQSWEGFRSDSGGPATRWYAGTSLDVAHRKEVRDVEIPNFHTLKKCGKFLPLNPFSVITETETFVLGEADCGNWIGNQLQTRCWGAVGGNPYGRDAALAFVDPVNHGIENAMGNSAITKAGSAEWDLGTWLAELRSTVLLLRDLSRLFTERTSLMAVEAASFRGDPWGRFRKYWLAGRYGIRPIVYDIQDASRALAVALNVDKRQLFTGRSKQEVELRRDKFVNEHYNWSPYFESTETWSLRGSRTYRGLAYAKPTPGNFLGGAVGFDPLVTLWELSRFSFVIDRFIDIGSLLGTVRPVLTNSLLGSCTGIKDEFLVTISTENVPKGSPSGQHGRGVWPSGTYQLRHESYRRAPFSGGLPGFEFDLDVAFAIDLVTLAVGGRNKVTNILNRR